MLLYPRHTAKSTFSAFRVGYSVLKCAFVNVSSAADP